IIEYIYAIVSKTRSDERLLFGASPRASEHLLYAARASAFLDGRDYAIPDDVKKVAQAVLSHRLLLKAEYELEGVSTKEIIREIIEETEVPV
ncbi:MAG TPA: magnesium chelatase, partial [Thermococcus sp.]|nr:magnesium chelatase [Thermococcus sp.]